MIDETALELDRYRKLAVAVMTLAVTDFAPHREAPRPPYRFIPLPKVQAVLNAVRLRIQAGAFLVERSDDTARMWQTMAGAPIGIRTRALWRAKYQELKQYETHLEWRLQAKTRAADQKRARVLRQIRRHARRLRSAETL